MVVELQGPARVSATLAEAAEAFLSSLLAASGNTRWAYIGVIDRLAVGLGPRRQLAPVPGDVGYGRNHRHVRPAPARPLSLRRQLAAGRLFGSLGLWAHLSPSSQRGNR